jgi:hypothetical protein
VYRGRLVHFYKRAQILVGDLWAAYGRPLLSDLHTDATCTKKTIYGFSDMDQLTMFADYRVPQILRFLGVISLLTFFSFSGSWESFLTLSLSEKRLIH